MALSTASLPVREDTDVLAIKEALDEGLRVAPDLRSTLGRTAT